MKQSIKIKQGLIFIAVLYYLSSNLLGYISEQDKICNRNMRAFTPIYCNTKRIPWDVWSENYEFVIDLVSDEKVEPKPASDLKNTFLGFRNNQTRIKVYCLKMDPSTKHILDRIDIGTYNVDEFKKVVPFNVGGRGRGQRVLDLNLEVKREKLDLEVLESDEPFGLFKKYAPVKIYSVSMKLENGKS